MSIARIALLVAALLTACQSAPEKSALATGDMALPIEIRQMLDRYEQMGLTLAADSTTGIVEACQSIIGAANKLVTTSANAVEKAAVMAVAPAAQGLMQSVQSRDLPMVRAQFAALSQAMATLAQGYPAIHHEHILVQCPMVTDGYNRWIQRQGKIRNPYKGREMLDCGSPQDWDK